MPFRKRTHLASALLQCHTLHIISYNWIFFSRYWEIQVLKLTEPATSQHSSIYTKTHFNFQIISHIDRTIKPWGAVHEQKSLSNLWTSYFPHKRKGIDSFFRINTLKDDAPSSSACDHCFLWWNWGRVWIFLLTNDPVHLSAKSIRYEVVRWFTDHQNKGWSRQYLEK